MTERGVAVAQGADLHIFEFGTVTLSYSALYIFAKFYLNEFFIQYAEKGKQSGPSETS